MYVSVPNINGKNVKDVKDLLKDFNVIYSGKGNTVYDVSPKAGTKIPTGSSVRVMLN